MKQKRTLLVIGADRDIFTWSYLAHVAQSRFGRIYCLSGSRNEDISPEQETFFQGKGIRCLYDEEQPDENRAFFHRVARRGGILLNRAVLRLLLCRADVAHILYLERGAWNSLVRFTGRKTKRIISFYGSDLLQANEEQLDWIGSILPEVDCVGLPSTKLEKRFAQIFGKTYGGQTYATPFGATLFDMIDQVRKAHTREECKSMLGGDPGLYWIGVGYNAQPNHQHLPVLEALGRLPENVLERIQVVLQMSYGQEGNEEYVARVKEACGRLGCKTLILEAYSLRGAALLRMGTDLFLHSQKTDSFSMSVQEYLYAGNLVLNPAWIRYPEVAEWGMHIREYPAISELPKYVEAAMAHGLTPEEARHNREMLAAHSSWENRGGQWAAMLDGVLGETTRQPGR